MLWWPLVTIGLVYALHNLISVLRFVRTVPTLASVEPRSAGDWPRVTHVVPACNEAGEVQAAVRSRLEEGYPNAEFVLINDRSTDNTGALIDELAESDGRIRVLHVVELPEGWLGKVHAMHCGVQVASGDWLLFSDADVHLQPGTMVRALSHCERNALDHLTVLPDIWRGTRALDIPMAFFLRIFSVMVRPWAVANPRSRAAIGVGAFNLVRASAFGRTPGFEALRMDVIDDLALGQMLKEHGSRSGVLSGHGSVGVRWYASVMDMARGAEKAALASFANYSVVRLALICALLLLTELAPFAGLFALGRPAVQAVAAISVLCLLTAQVIPSIWFGRPWWPAILSPLAVVLSVAFLLRAGWLAVRRGGIAWRGTLYPAKVLRRNARLRFP